MAVYSPSFAALFEPVKFFAYRNASMNVTGGSAVTLITFDADLFDTASSYSVSTGRFTPGVSGTYMIGSNIGLGSGLAGVMALYLYKNGSLYQTLNQGPVANNDIFSGSTIIQLGTTDYLQVEVLNTGTTAAVLVGTGPYQTYFWAFLLSTS